MVWFYSTDDRYKLLSNIAKGSYNLSNAFLIGRIANFLKVEYSKELFKCNILTV